MAVPQGFKTITCYLPPEIADKLQAYCLENQITRKDKQGDLSPSWGTGIVEVLKLFFRSDTLPSPISGSGLSNALNQEMVKDLVGDLVKDSLNSLLPNTLPSEDNLKESITNLLPSLLPEQNNQIDWDKAIANSPIVGEVLERLETIDNERLTPITLNNLEDHPVIQGLKEDIKALRDPLFFDGKFRFVKDELIVEDDCVFVRVHCQDLKGVRAKFDAPGIDPRDSYDGRFPIDKTRLDLRSALKKIGMFTQKTFESLCSEIVEPAIKASLDKKKLENEPTPIETPETEETNTDVLNHTDILPSEDCQESPPTQDNDVEPIKEDERPTKAKSNEYTIPGLESVPQTITERLEKATSRTLKKIITAANKRGLKNRFTGKEYNSATMATMIDLILDRLTSEDSEIIIQVIDEVLD